MKQKLQAGNEPSSSTTRPIRVLYVNDVAFVIQTLAPYLSDEKVQAEIVGRSAGDPTIGRTPFAANVLAIRRGLHARGKFDLIHVNYGLFGMFSLTRRLPTVLHLHGSDVRPSTSIRGKLANLLSRLGMHYCAQVWYSTPDLATHLDGLQLDHRFMPNPVGNEFFQMPIRAPSPPTVLFAVPLTRLKGADMGIRAMRELSDFGGDFRIQAFGFGPLPEEVDALRQAIPAGVEVLSWSPHVDMPRVFAEASVVVGQLHLGCLGITELEAMAAGKPLVTNLDKPLSQSEAYYSEDPPAVACNTPEAVARSAWELLADGKRAGELGRKGRDWARRYHSPQGVANLYREAYDCLLGFGEGQE